MQRPGAGTASLDHPLLGSDTAEAQPWRPQRRQWASLDARDALAAALFLLGVVAVLLGWFGIARETEVSEQFPYLASGGIGGAVLIGLAITAFIAGEHARDREHLDAVLERLTAVESELRGLSERLDDGSRLEPAAGRDRVDGVGVTGGSRRSTNERR